MVSNNGGVTYRGHGLINHIALVLDRSTSMNHLKNKVVEVADEFVKSLAADVAHADQETRVTIYTFGRDIDVAQFDQDVRRFESVAGRYIIAGDTALMDATLRAIEDLSRTATMYGDHAFLLYIVTDGEENSSVNQLSAKSKITWALAQPDWTIGLFVPTTWARTRAIELGFPSDNIATWSATEVGTQVVADTITASTQSYLINRAAGIRGTTTPFAQAVAGLTKEQVHQKLDTLSWGDYRQYQADRTDRIDDTVHRLSGRPYRVKSAFYQLIKTETIQDDKELLLVEKSTGKLYGGPNARHTLGLPSYGDVRVGPAHHPEYTIYVQSHSYNRNVLAGQGVIVRG